MESLLTAVVSATANDKLLCQLSLATKLSGLNSNHFSVHKSMLWTSSADLTQDPMGLGSSGGLTGDRESKMAFTHKAGCLRSPPCGLSSRIVHFLTQGQQQCCKIPVPITQALLRPSASVPAAFATGINLLHG
jgi:hypothetical protein